MKLTARVGTEPMSKRGEMDPSWRSLMVVSMFGMAAGAQAQPAPIIIEPTVSSLMEAAAAEQLAREVVAQSQIADAVRDLEQAALQSDFSSNARELAFLQHAHEQLRAAAKQLDGARFDRIIDLLADLEHAVDRASTRAGPPISPAEKASVARAPSHNQLAQLATEGQDLERNAPTAHRLVDGNGLGSTARQPRGAQAPMGQISTIPWDADMQTWSPEPRATSPQLRLRF
jgi:hypothetical protein